MCSTMAPPLDNVLDLNDLWMQDSDKCQVPESSGAENKKKSSRMTGSGLREFSRIVCKKVKEKGRTTYNEVADEIFSELVASAVNNGQEFDEKNIRRRVYDAFNVLISINIIAKDKKEIKWMGDPRTRSEQIKDLKEVRMEVLSRIRAKERLLQEIEQQFDDLQNLKLRNQRVQNSADIAEGVPLPFLLVKTSRKALVEIEISEDARTVHFDFNGTPFSLHDDVLILEAMRRSRGTEKDQLAAPGSLEGSTEVPN